jgi:hypothetical protein
MALGSILKSLKLEGEWTDFGSLVSRILNSNCITDIVDARAVWSRVEPSQCVRHGRSDDGLLLY